MNYKNINDLILNGNTLSEEVIDDDILRYVLANNVLAIYLNRFGQGVSKESRRKLEIVTKALHLANNKFQRTLRLITEICKKHNIDFLLFKTYKCFGDEYLGDIDLLVRENQIEVFVDNLKTVGFSCRKEGRKKYECRKKIFSKIEPRTEVVFHGIKIFGQEDLWKNKQVVKIKASVVPTTSSLIDTYALLFNVFYGPKYMDLYLYKLVRQNMGAANVFVAKANNDYINRFLKGVSIRGSNQKFPVFPSNTLFFDFWLKEITKSRYISLFSKLKHLIFFLYIKYKYLFFNKLEFSHSLHLSR